MTIEDQIIGFRRDRIGARVICLLNIMRLSRKFNVSGKYLWLSEPDGPYPELADPHDFLAPDFIGKHIRIVTSLPEIGTRQNVNAVAPGVNAAGFAATLAAGQRYECDSMADIVRVMDESPAEAEAGMREIAQDIVLAPHLAEALADARKMVRRAGGGEPVAIHVRRGDILDGDPWSYSSWSSKYVPDEFYRAFIAQSHGPVIAFSDTPPAVAHLAQGDPRVVQVGELFDSRKLSLAARDLLVLLLMAGCAEVGAPSHSAFSRAASTIGPCRIAALPATLTKDGRNDAYDALLERAIAHPDRFYAPGDLAQSLCYATKHAITTGRGAELVDKFAAQGEFLDRFPFLFRELAVTAWSVGHWQKARQLAQRGLASPLIRGRDKPQCRQVLLITEADDTTAAAGRDIESQFLTTLLTGRAADGPIIPTLAHHLLSRPEDRLAATLLFPPALLPFFAQQPPEGARSGQSLPVWVLRLDWSEFVPEPALQREFLQWPDMWGKMRPVADGLGEIEAALAADPSPQVSKADALRFGFCASVLRLHGRFKRAFALLHWLDKTHPAQALTHKRLADACFAAGNRKAGWRWLTSAQSHAGPNVMLALSAAIRAAQENDLPRAEQHLQAAAALWPNLGLITTVRREFLRQLQ